VSRADASVRRGLPSAGVAAPADKRFLRPDVRSGRRGRLFGFGWPAVRLALVGLVIAGMAIFAATAVLRSRLLAIDRIVVLGNTRVSSGEVEAVLNALRGENLLLANLDAYRSRIVDSPWVAGVTLRRVLPSTVEVRVVERVPMALARIGQQLYLVDPGGVIIDEYGPQYAEFDLPVVDGLVSTAAAGAPLLDERRARFTAHVLDTLAVRPDLRARVSQLDVADTHDVVVLLKDDPAFLHLGEAQFVERIARYLELAPTLREKLADLDYVDLRFDERIYVRSRKAAVTVVKK
jgi:cell division protein FtsQ